MRKQKGAMGAAYLNLVPAVVLAPAAIESKVVDLFKQDLDPNDANKVNTYQNEYEPVIHPVMDETSATAWYMFADPAIAPTQEVCFLDSQANGPIIETELGFQDDTIKWKVRHVIGVGIVDYRGGYKNPGV